MAINKVEANGETLIDLTNDTATANHVLAGQTFHLASGVQATGTLNAVSELESGENIGFIKETKTDSSAKEVSPYYGSSTVSGTLPLTFNSVDGELDDWTLTGNAQGVGERTKNLLDTTNVDVTSYDVRVYTDNNRIHVSGTFSKTSGNSVISIASITLLSGTYTVSGADADIYSDYGYRLQVIDVTGGGAVTLGYDSGEGYTFELSSETLIAVRVHITGAKAYNVPVDFVFPVMLRSADTDNSFIPYGYQIPITSGEDTEIIYVGSTPLGENQSVTKASTGVEIPTFNGTNTITTTLSNKPSMELSRRNDIGSYIQNTYINSLTERIEALERAISNE